MQLAKAALDVGLYTNQLDPMLAFWQQYAAYDELLKLGGGAHQHRHQIGDSILKVNHTREPTPRGEPTGLKELIVYSDQVDEKVDLLDPDGNAVVLTPPLADRNLTLVLACNSVAQSMHFYGEVMGLEAGEVDAEFRVGASSILLTPGSVGPFARAGIGYRYMTVQVFDVVGTHQAVLAAGGSEGMAPTKLGDVAYIAFVKDPDGNWIEISQRKSITGSLD